MKRLAMSTLLLALLLLSLSAQARYFRGGAANGSVSSCPDNDGSSGASAGTAQFPTLLSGYAATINGTHGLGCLVAGVNYHVGPATGTSFVNPTGGGVLPSGCTLSGSVVTCSGNNITFQNFDMTVSGGLQVNITGSNNTITNNKFAVQSPNCLSPIVFLPGGTYTITYNQIDGGGAACAALGSGFSADVYDNQTPANGTIVVFRWNYASNTSEDGINYTGSSTGGITVHHDFNVVCGQGFAGHPDGIQLTGGKFTNSDTLHNTYINNAAGCGGADGGDQPYHIEAQLTSTVTNWTVSYNTMVTPGTCNGGTNFPTGCVANFDIACKQDSPGSPTNVNTGFIANGNYIDWSGTIAPLLQDNCASPIWGTPIDNYDMVAGTTLTHSP